MEAVSRYDAVVIGAGAAGIFAARELGRAGLRVLLVERGHSLDRRACVHRDASGECRRCDPCNVLCGWGGAGAYSDGKLSLSPHIGGFLTDLLPKGATEELLAFVDAVYRAHGAPETIWGGDSPEFQALSIRADKAGLRLSANPLRHLGTEHCREVLGSLEKEVAQVAEVRYGAFCEDVLAEGGKVTGVVVSGETIAAPAVVIAAGRVGSGWVREIAAKLGIPTRPNPVDIGIRVECPADAAEPMTRDLYEAKLLYTAPTFRDEVRTFCMNPRGEVVHEVYEDCLSVNGHSYAERATKLTNFALLVKTAFTEPFDDPIAYGKSVARLANLLGGGILVQRFADLVAGRRSTPARIAQAKYAPTLSDATPGDLSFALPHRHMVDLTEMLYALESFCPGIAGPDTFLYGVEVKLYSNRLVLDAALATPVEGLYGAGDGVGVSRGLMQASASGVHAARSVLRAAGRRSG
jgi:uncharacterized FAD-dependent dehydrogenase